MIQRTTARLALFIAAGVALAGCATGLSDTQKIAARNASVKYYDDNSFALRSNSFFVWSALASPSSTAIAISVDYLAYNIKDVQTISVAQRKGAKYETFDVTLNLKDGTSVTGDRTDMRWWLCEKSKGCTYAKDATSHSQPQAFNGLVRYISKKNLAKLPPEVKPSRLYDYSGLDFFRMDGSKSTVTVLSSDEATQLHTSLARLNDSWNAGEAARTAAAAESSKRYKASEEQRLKDIRNVRIGTVDLCTTSFAFPGPIQKDTSISCQQSGAKMVYELLNGGWVIASSVAVPLDSPVGAALNSSSHNITFQKVR
ncbi:hypothetical protein [Comamonas thiooxydans]|uniref:hypothetical protein n=1 Tax=Comamonas thiooxydans TaxID=363952 RepID=UPI0011849D8C|nr:hypothetical protein [Comamonas thiooxydans]